MVTIIAFLGVFGLLVMVHELGHFATAKLSGVKVLEFGLGFPPRLLRFQRGETTYTLNAIPFGGFVRMMGEEDPSDPRSLAGKPVPIRAMVISAGAMMNALLPILLFAIVFMVPKDTVVGDVTILSVADNSPAAEAGLLPGDVITRVNGRRVENLSDLSYQLALRRGANATVMTERGGEVLSQDVVPRWKPPEGQGATGITVELAAAHEVSRSKPFFSAIWSGARRTVETVVLAKNEIQGWFIGDREPQVSGPVGIAQITGEVAGLGFLPLLELAALLSLNLAVLNILPLPALDGGRLLFLAIEVVRRGKRVPPQKEALVHLAGFVVLITAILIISYFDVLRIARGDSLLGG